MRNVDQEPLFWGATPAPSSLEEPGIVYDQNGKFIGGSVEKKRKEKRKEAEDSKSYSLIKEVSMGGGNRSRRGRGAALLRHHAGITCIKYWQHGMKSTFYEDLRLVDSRHWDITMNHHG